MLDREPFLRAIFADPDSDLPRLAFADWLDDHGDGDWAELIRVQCAIARRPHANPGDDAELDALRHRELQLRCIPPLASLPARGFPDYDTIKVEAELLADPDGFRRRACDVCPHWYGATGLQVDQGRLTDPAAVETMFRSPVTEHVTALDLSGREEHVGTAHDDVLGIGLIDFVHKPAISTRMVEHLCGLREARRLVRLDLTRNDLDNDALRALARSTNLIRLRELHLSDGNPRVKGRVWSQVLERFGPEVVR